MCKPLVRLGSYKPMTFRSWVVDYLYTGVQSNLKPYSSTTKAPTEPGVYTMTAVTVGGNYQAAPIIRTFTITK